MGTLTLDSHDFERATPVWDDTEVYHHTCDGVTFNLVRVGNSWSWWAVVSPEVTLRMDATAPRPLSAREAWAEMEGAVNQRSRVAAGW